MQYIYIYTHTHTHTHIYTTSPLIISNTTVKLNTCSSDNKCCEKLWFITNPPLQNIKTRETSTKAARILTRALCHGGSEFQPETVVYFIESVTPSADPQRSSAHINNVETPTAINYIIAPDECQTLLWDPQ
jgi:hypothetical protein